MRGVSRALAALVVALLPASPHAATNGTQYRDWTLACRATAINETECVLTQILVEASSNAFIAEIGVSLQASTEGPVAVLVLRVPVGVLLLRTPSALVDQDAQDTAISLDWQSCDATYCAATAVLNVAQTQRLKKGRSALVGYQQLGASDPTVFQVSLLGITAGMDVLSQALDGKE